VSYTYLPVEESLHIMCLLSFFVNCFITKFPGILSFLLLGAQSDVNTVCFADESGHLVYSGSDDTFCKVQIRYNFEDILLLFVKD